MRACRWGPRSTLCPFRRISFTSMVQLFFACMPYPLDNGDQEIEPAYCCGSKTPKVNTPPDVNASSSWSGLAYTRALGS